MMCRVLFVALVVALATAFNAGRMGKKFVKLLQQLSCICDNMSDFPMKHMLQLLALYI